MHLRNGLSPSQEEQNQEDQHTDDEGTSHDYDYDYHDSCFVAFLLAHILNVSTGALGKGVGPQDLLDTSVIPEEETEGTDRCVALDAVEADQVHFIIELKYT